MKVLNLLIPVIAVVIAVKVFGVDSIDRNNPFGTDKAKNDKYTKGKSGESYGVQTFWGKPSSKDTIKDALDKIQWLTHSAERDIHWRRSFISAVVAAIIIVLSINAKLFYKPVYFFLVVFMGFIMCYFTLTYYVRHLLDRRIKFVDRHVRKIKSKLKISLRNSIDENPII